VRERALIRCVERVHRHHDGESAAGQRGSDCIGLEGAAASAYGGERAAGRSEGWARL
jgi:hypothetical protein